MSIRPLILKDGVYTIPRSSTDTNNIVDSLGVVDTSRNQTIGGVKTFSSPFVLSSTTGTSIGTIWRNVDTLEYKDSTNTTKIILNSAGNLSNLSNKQIALNNLVGTQTANKVLRSDGTNITLSSIALDTDVTNVLPITSGGTGSNSQNFVDISTNQNIAGNKYFNRLINIGVNSSLTISQYTNSDIQTFNSANALNILSGSFTASANLAATLPIYLTDVEINSANTNTLGLTIGHQYRIRNFGTGLVSNLQGGRFTALNSGTGNVSVLDGGYFLSRQEGTGSTTTVTGGNFLAQITVGTANAINGVYVTVSSSAATTLTTARGIYVTASSSNTTPATDCIGIDIASITGTATNKYAIRTGTGRVVIGDTTATTSTTTGSLVTGGGIAAGGGISANLPTSSAGLLAGAMWRSGNDVKIV